MTMEIRTLIVDDEQPAREELAFLLSSFPDIQVVGQARNGLEAVDLIARLKPDLVLLDIQMPGLDGFGVARRMLSQAHPPHIVFVTAYDQYALQAFEVSALDYLLKPIGGQKLGRAVQRAREHIERRMSMVDKLQELLQALPDASSSASRPLSRLPVRMDDGRLILVDAQDLAYFYIDHGVIYGVTVDRQGTTSYRTLEELGEDLDPDVFVRTHRSYIVNIHRVQEIIPWFAGTYRLKMDDPDESEVPLSRAQAKRLRKMLKW
jgi:two-component system LytT family response regulator/two-component system response regulator LytT